MSTTALDITAVRARFSALDRRLAFFDGPGGTQCPDEVIDAISRYLREDNANIGAPYETSIRTTELVDLAHETAGCVPRLLAGRGRLRPEHDLAQLPAHAGVRADAARGRRDRRARRSTTTRTSRRGSSSRTTSASSSAWRGLTDDLELDYDDLDGEALRAHARRRLPGRGELGRDRARRRAASSSSRTRPARSRGRTPSTTRRTARSTSRRGTSTSSSARRTSSSARTWAWRSGSGSCSSRGAPYKVRPAANEPVGHRFELGTSQHELLAGFVAAVDYIDSLGWDAMLVARARARRALPRRPPGRRSSSTASDDGRPRADVLLQRAGAHAGGGRDASSRSARSRSGTATTTRSRR